MRSQHYLLNGYISTIKQNIVRVLSNYPTINPKPILFFLTFLITPSLIAQDFTWKRLRINYEVCGNSDSQSIRVKKILRERHWGGSRLQLIDPLKYGKYFIELRRVDNNKVIYSRGFSDLFIEWQTTQDAKERNRCYTQSMNIPEPNMPCSLNIYRRNSTHNFVLLKSIEIKPNSSEIKKFKAPKTSYKKIHSVQPSHKALDIIFIGEGYTKNEKEKFFRDAQRFTTYLFNWDPYKQHKANINLGAVFSPSAESGVDIPGDSLWVNTLLDAHFYTFNIERYLTIANTSKIYDYLANYPYDQVVVLVNSSKYGGGGMFNFYNIFTVDHADSEKLFLHEFGHGFADLADEYFSSEVAYDTSNTEVALYEPYEPNITTLFDFEAKWKNQIHDSVPVPTPDSSAYEQVVGVYEGANYRTKGYYRPYRNCMMRSFKVGYFCPVCTVAIERMLELYIK